MKLRRINAISAGVSLLGALLWLVLGDPFAAFVWLVCSIIWIGLSLCYARSARTDPHPFVRVRRRIMNLFLFS